MDLLMIAHPLNGLLMIALAIGLGIFLSRKFHLGWKLWWIGAATFVLSQVGHIPFNALLTLLFERKILPAPPEAWQIPFSAIVLGLSAGGWETTARYLTYRWWAKEARSWKQGLMMGAGHGGSEAILSGVLVLFTFANMIALQGVDLSTVVPADQLPQAIEQVQTYWSLRWFQVLLGPVERAMALVFHMALSLLVMQTFIRKQKRWFWLALFWHALIDAAAVYTVQALGIYMSEVVVGCFSLASVAIIFALRPFEEESKPPGSPAVEEIPVAKPIAPPEETTEKIEGTRYNG